MALFQTAVFPPYVSHIFPAGLSEYVLMTVAGCAWGEVEIHKHFFRSLLTSGLLLFHWTRQDTRLATKCRETYFPFLLNHNSKTWLQKGWISAHILKWCTTINIFSVNNYWKSVESQVKVIETVPMTPKKWKIILGCYSLQDRTEKHSEECSFGWLGLWKILEIKLYD